MSERDARHSSRDCYLLLQIMQIIAIRHAQFYINTILCLGQCQMSMLISVSAIMCYAYVSFLAAWHAWGMDGWHGKI